MRMKPKYKATWEDFADLVMRPTPMFKFLTSMSGHCRVWGCHKFAGKHPLCRKHQGSTKFQHLAQS
jgi:hypothetical protein